MELHPYVIPNLLMLERPLLRRDCLVLLGKGPRDELVRLNGRGFAQLFSQIVQHPWDADYMERALGLAQALCEEAPVYFYSCTKRPQAALTLRDALEREEERHGADQ